MGWTREYGKWFIGYFCLKCIGEMSFEQQHGKDGCCPHCGHTNDGTHGSVAEKKVCRYVWYTPPWYLWWKWEKIIEFK